MFGFRNTTHIVSMIVWAWESMIRVTLSSINMCVRDYRINNSYSKLAHVEAVQMECRKGDPGIIVCRLKFPVLRSAVLRHWQSVFQSLEQLNHRTIDVFNRLDKYIWRATVGELGTREIVMYSERTIKLFKSRIFEQTQRRIIETKLSCSICHPVTPVIRFYVWARELHTP